MVDVRPLNLRFRVRRGKLPPIYDETTEWYQGWYFDLRLEEELSRSKRYSLPLAVVAIRLVNKPDFGSRHFREAMRALRNNKLRRSDIPAIQDERDLVVCLTHTERKQAEVVIRRIRNALGEYRPAFGVASYPEDGAEPEVFLTVAEHRALAEALDSGENYTLSALRSRRGA